MLVFSKFNLVLNNIDRSLYKDSNNIPSISIMKNYFDQVNSTEILLANFTEDMCSDRYSHQYG